MANKVDIPFIEQSPLVPMVRIFLPDGTAGYALVDTGSESTLFDKEFVKKNKGFFEIEKTRNKLTLVGVDSKKEHPVLNVKTKVFFTSGTFRTDDYQITGMISDLSCVNSHTKEHFDLEIDALIGSDTLHELNAEVNFQEKVVLIDHDLPGKR